MIRTEQLELYKSRAEEKSKTSITMSIVVAYLTDLIRVSKEEDAKREKEEAIKEAEIKNEKRAKGYGYDSLVFRFKEARYKQAELEAIEARKNGKDLYTAKERADKRAGRDFMRFCQILDDLLGEHD